MAAVTTLFRFATAGSVDDGKSTLVGRLLHDSKAILADCPGHVQYTRNMVTGATTADAVVVLVDGRKGVVEQTRRHLAVIALLRVPHVIVAVNKIDLLGFAPAAYSPVEAQVRALAAELGIPDPHVLPVSALEGDNVVDRSPRTPWYDGPALLELLETLPAAADEPDDSAFRLPVQLVLRPQGGLAARLADDPEAVERHRDYRAAAGRIASGTITVGDRVAVFPHGTDTTVAGIEVAGVPVVSASAPQSVALRLADDVDAARGAVIAAAGTLPAGTREIRAELFQLDGRPLASGSRVLVKHGTATVQGVVEVTSRYDLAALVHEPATTLAVNDIGRARIRLAADLPVEPYAADRAAGSFVVIHPSDGATLAAGTALAADTVLG